MRTAKNTYVASDCLLLGFPGCVLRSGSTARRFFTRHNINEEVELVGLAQSLRDVCAREGPPLVGIGDDESPSGDFCNEDYEACSAHLNPCVDLGNVLSQALQNRMGAGSS